MSQKPTVIQTRQFPSPGAALKWISDLQGQYRKQDDLTNTPLYKTPAGVVLRLAKSTTVEVLSNCAC